VSIRFSVYSKYASPCITLQASSKDAAPTHSALISEPAQRTEKCMAHTPCLQRRIAECTTKTQQGHLQQRTVHRVRHYSACSLDSPCIRP
jgi:hypothetical protein